MNKILSYTSCNLCGRNCRINRTSQKGYCRVNDKTIISSHLLHFGEEPPISGTNGSGTVFFSGCSLGCVFCQNHQISAGLHGVIIDENELTEIFLQLQSQGAHNINLVTPTHYSLAIKNSIINARDNGLNIPVVYNSSGFDSIENLHFMDEVIDIYLPDFKFIHPELSLKYCNSGEYPEICMKNIEFMMKSRGLLKIDEDGIAYSGTLIRHLVIPGSINNSIDILNYLLNSYGHEIYLSVMSQFSPEYNSISYPEINRKLFQDEYQLVISLLNKNCMENIFCQELISSDIYLPDFRKSSPFIF